MIKIEPMSIKEAAASAGVPQKTIKEWINNGVFDGRRLPVCTDGEEFWVEKEDLDRFIADIENGKE